MEDNKPKNVHVETYADHLAGAMHDNSEGAIRKIIEQERAYEEAKRNLSPKKVANQLYLYSGIVVMVVALGIVGYVAMGKVKKEVPLEPQYTPIVFNDDTVFAEVDADKEKTVASLLSKARAGEMDEKGLRGIYLTENKQIIGFSRFLSLMEANITLGEVNPFQENFLLGAVEGDTRDLFVLIRVTSFAEAFNSLRGWERKMFYDLHDLFEVPLNTDTSYLQIKDFEDGIVENKNARVLRDNDGKIVIMYVFADEDFVIISKSESAVREVVLRLAGSRTNR